MSQQQTQTITLEGQTYAVTDLTPTAMSTVQSLLFAEMRIRELQTEIAINRAAHLGFMQGLKTELSQQAPLKNR
jgi:hypothetical protein